MDRNELIEKAKKFWAERANQPAGQSSTRAEAMADFVLSLEPKDEKNDEWWLDGYWTPLNDDSVFVTDNMPSEIKGDDDNGLIFRTEEESECYRRQRIARTAIHRWIAENAEKVDWTDGERKCYPLLSVDSGMWNVDWWTGNRIPGWFYVYEKDYDRMMADNAQHFDVLKEGL